ncbi:PREDICTED: alveolar macrophage chemotactic factor-like isoform X1 [Gekko japonicus]|uniref:Alveolar macrophage chemotactic factor-like isoform X1 n=1 Tax=Gekko japonicus TaxID=146911 RepID=A0ABM1L634_GEKJA|nr:PREDICTED: alveolar macrophage chemotactic factor-like isoform X1 [Gekko japonicus]
MSPSRRVSLVLFLSLLAGSLLPSRAAPLTSELRCQCIELFSGRIPIKRFARLNLYPAGPHCANTEVIATTTEGREVCLDPEAPWVKVAIKRILEKNNENNQL